MKKKYIYIFSYIYRGVRKYYPNTIPQSRTSSTYEVMLTAYFFVLVLCLLNCSSCASGSEELSDADLLLLKNLWNNQLESDAQREEANSHLNGVLWKEAGHGRCPRWVADNPILVRVYMIYKERQR